MLVHSYVNSSVVNGPGNRFVLWTQGCSKKCKDCYNPETWKKSGVEYETDHIVSLISASNVDGLTISGGDPLEQPDELLELLVKVKNLNLTKGVIVFTGYTMEEIHNIGGNTMKCLDYLDVLIDGRYENEKRVFNGLYGSSNQNVHHFSSKIWIDEMEMDHEIEVGINGNEIYITGFPVCQSKELIKLGIKMK